MITIHILTLTVILICFLSFFTKGKIKLACSITMVALALYALNRF